MTQQPVLIVGAGPTGLVLALWLTKIGVPVRLIDKSEATPSTSRALVVQARTLEFYRQMGIDQVAEERGIDFNAANLWLQGKQAGRIPLNDLGAAVSPHPSALILPQDQHEQLLIEQLDTLGVHVERNTELLSFEFTDRSVMARLRNALSKEESYETPYLVGCDGAHSVVRKTLGIGFPGGVYDNTFYVADVVGSGPVTNGELHVTLDDADFLGIFPMKGAGRVRLVGAVRRAPEPDRELRWEDVSTGIIQRSKLTVHEVNWFSTYRVHHRVAAHFRSQRAFLLGDAAHIHSPVGGQGMNTGIGDAVNLAWKLGEVLRGRAPESLLDTYEPERIAFARKLVSTTDQAFSLVSAQGPVAKTMRKRVLPRLLPLLFRFAAVRRRLYCLVSQTAISYPHSALSVGRRGRVKAGDRLPWLPAGAGRGNFDGLRDLAWQVHVYGSPQDWLQGLCRARAVPLRVFPWDRPVGRAGLRKDWVYVVRPDGHVGMVQRGVDATRVTAYFDAWSIGARP